MTNWKQRYSHKLVPMPNGLDQYIRHLHEHGWAPKGGLSSFKPHELEYLNDHAVDVHDYLHEWVWDKADADPTGYFYHISQGKEDYDDRQNDHDHSHPESGKSITGVEKRYTDD